MIENCDIDSKLVVAIHFSHFDPGHTTLLRKAVLICYHKYQGNAYHGVKHLYKLATTIVILGFTFWTDIQDLKTSLSLASLSSSGFLTR